MLTDRDSQGRNLYISGLFDHFRECIQDPLPTTLPLSFPKDGLTFPAGLETTYAGRFFGYIPTPDPRHMPKPENVQYSRTAAQTLNEHFQWPGDPTVIHNCDIGLQREKHSLLTTNNPVMFLHELEVTTLKDGLHLAQFLTVNLRLEYIMDIAQRAGARFSSPN